MISKIFLNKNFFHKLQTITINNKLQTITKKMDNLEQFNEIEVRDSPFDETIENFDPSRLIFKAVERNETYKFKYIPVKYNQGTEDNEREMGFNTELSGKLESMWRRQEKK